MKTVKSILVVALAALSFVAVAKPGKKAPQTLKVDASASTFNWLAKKLTGEHNGTVKIQSGNLVTDGGKLTGGDFTVDFSTIKDLDIQGDFAGKLETHLKSADFFDVAQFPTSTLKITKAVAKGGENYDLTGNLTIRGITQSITFPAIVKVTGKTASASAKFDIDRTKFGLTYRSKAFFENIGDKMIYDNFTVDVKIVASAPM
ncbi:YceI family protein [Runella sp.]|jgi:polyisoprenoid-binding protein YceI|uniref:YceI family protein n=1 Tax=Runella sp. TaxID=1960881 RepID=UPI002637E969|nr:YceI family protein [Runella sp.]